MTKITILKTDITTLNVDAIINSANPSLLAGSGLCGLIHKMAGRELEQECKSLGDCAKGQAKITNGYNLNAKYVIHAVGPHYILDSATAAELLESCYYCILQLANEYDLKSIAIPSISTNIYQYPIIEASHIAFKTIQKILKNQDSSLEEIILAVKSDETKEIYEKLFTVYLSDLQPI